MSTVLKWCNDNHTFLITLIITAICYFWLGGCESKVHSISMPEKLITRSELQAEIDFQVATAAARFESLDMQDAVKRQFIDALSVYSTTGSFNPLGMLPILTTIVGVGTAINQTQKANKAKKA